MERANRTKDLPPIDIKKQYLKTTKVKTTKIDFDKQFGLYTCFKQGAKGASSCLVGIVVDKDMIVMLDPMSFEKKIVYKMPSLDLNIHFSKYLYAD